MLDSESSISTKGAAAMNDSDYPPLISIVVLAYNCEKFIPKCLDSLANQDCPQKNYEVYITDDGSKDSTGKICDEYAGKYPFIHVTHTPNQGTSAARNVSIPKCKGRYIVFCDSDDYVSPQYISVLTRAIELHDDADMLVFRYVFDLPGGKWPVCDTQGMKASDWTEISSASLLQKVFGDISIGGYTWNKAVKREIVQSTLFNESMSVHDDHWWTVKILTKHKDMKIYLSDYALYCYVQHPGFGQSRIPGRIYMKDGMSWFVACIEDELTFEGVTPEIARQLEGLIYYWSTQNMYRTGLLMSDEVRAKIKGYLRKYAMTYYFGSVQPFSWKLRALARHIACILHIHKYKPQD